MKTNDTLLVTFFSLALALLAGSSVQAADSLRAATRVELSAAIAKAVAEILPAGIVIEKLGSVSEIKVPSKGYITQARWPGEQVFRRRVSFPIELWSSDKLFRTLQVAATLAIEAKLPVAAVNIPAQSTVRAEQITMQKVRLTDTPEQYARDLSVVVSRQVNRNMESGEPFLVRDLERIPIINRGQAVSIESNIGLIHIRATGTAHEDGAIGDRIHVVVQSVGRLLNATVVAPGRAEVLP